MKKPTGINDLVRDNAGKMAYRWLPVVRKSGMPSQLGVDIGRSLIEEIGFAPSKIWVLTRLFASKATRDPGFLTWFYVSVASLVVFMPWFIAQGVLWQSWRAVRATYKVLTGGVTYMAKSKVLSRKD